jgi:hypothetical protein
MLIREINIRECRDLLERLGAGRLGCARDNQPYIVPIYFAYEPDRLYGFSTVGQKIEWMRRNPKVCVEADEVISHNNWVSVIALGRFEELTDKPGTKGFGGRRKPCWKSGRCGGKRRARLLNRAANRSLRRRSFIVFTLKN